MTAGGNEDETIVSPQIDSHSERLATILDQYMSELETTGLPPDVERRPTRDDSRRRGEVAP